MKITHGHISALSNTTQCETNYLKPIISTSRTKSKPTTLTTLTHRLPPFHHAWNQIFLLSNQPECEVAIELCCGQSPKIGIAIHQSSLAKSVGYVDMSQSALQICQQLVQHITPDCNSFFLNNSLATLRYHQPLNLITGNHIFDDLLIQHFLEHIDKTNTTAYTNKQDFVALINKVVLYYQTNGDDFLNDLATHFTRLTASNGRIILSDYMSYYEQSYGIVDWPRLRFSLAERLGHHLIHRGFREITIHSLPSLFNRVHIWEKR